MDVVQHAKIIWGKKLKWSCLPREVVSKCWTELAYPFIIYNVQSVKNQVIFFSFEKQCNAVSMTFFSLIRKIKPILHFNFLTDAACQKSVHSLIASWLDYEHLLLYNIQCTLLIASTLNNKLKTKILSPSYLIYISFLLWVECTINMCIQGAP